jgi:hypothetical protein
MIEFGWLIGALIAIFAALVGVGVRRITKFIYPFDFLSMIVCVAVAALIISMPITGKITGLWTGSPINAAGYGAFILGYVFGYAIDGFRAYFMLRRRIPKDKCAPAEPCVRYKVKGRWAWAGQTNKFLWERLIHKNHIYIICNVPLGDPDWQEPTKYPLFPTFDRPMMMAEDFGLKDAIWKADRGKEKTRKRQVFLIKKAHGSQISTDQLCFEADGVQKANEATAEAQHKFTSLLHFIKAELPRLFSNFLAGTYNKAPGMAFINVTRHIDEMMKDQADDEIRLKTETEKELDRPIKDKEVTTDVQQKTEEGKGTEGQEGKQDSV